MWEGGSDRVKSGEIGRLWVILAVVRCGTCSGEGVDGCSGIVDRSRAISEVERTRE